VVGEHVELNFLSGVTVSGRLKSIYRQDQLNLIFTFVDCTVTQLDGERLFEPEWGIFDMVVGTNIGSVYGGSADRDAYPLYETPSLSATQTINYDEETSALFDHYALLANLRKESVLSREQVETLLAIALGAAQEEWLLCFEIVECLQANNVEDSLIAPLLAQLESLASSDDEDRTRLIRYGLDRLSA